MLAAVRRLKETGPKHNPLARLWIAAALVAVDDPEGPKLFAAETQAVEKSHETQASAIVSRVLESLCQSGVKGALLLYVDLADRQITEMRAKTPPEERAWESTPLAQLYHLLGWPQPQAQMRRVDRTRLEGKIDAKAELTRAKEWLTKNIAALSWDPQRRRFVYDVPPPGMETLYPAAKAVEKKFGLNCLDRLAQQQYGDTSQLIGEIVNLMGQNTEAAKDAAVGDLLLAILDQPASRNVYQYESRSLLLLQLPKLNRELGVKVWARVLKTALSDETPMTDTLFGGDQRPDEEVVRAACALLLPEYQKAYTDARAAGNVEVALRAAMQQLYVGGKPDRKEVAALLDKAPVTWVAGRNEGTLSRWSYAMSNAHRTGYLRLLLISASRELDSYRPGQGGNHPLSQFQYTCGWGFNNDGAAGTGAEVLATCEEWLDANEARLKWDSRQNRFTGAPSPAIAALLKVTEPLQRHGLKAEELLNDPASGRNQQESVKKLLEAVLKLGEANAEAAKDPEWAKAVTSLAVRSRGQNWTEVTDLSLETRLVKLNRESAVSLLAERYDKRLEKSKQTPPYGIDARQGIPLDVLNEARARLLPKYQKLYEEAAKAAPAERCLRTLNCLYLGGQLDDASVQKALGETQGGMHNGEVQVAAWARGICESGNPAGLRVVLLYGKVRNDEWREAVSQFLAISGLNRGGMVRDAWPRGPEDLDYYLKWLKDAEQEIRWDATARRFVAPSFKPPPKPAVDIPADRPFGDPPAVKPPRPPERVPEKVQDNF
jgi:hypothetical protein